MVLQMIKNKNKKNWVGLGARLTKDGLEILIR